MAKTITEYEASDIDLDKDPLHKTLFGAVLGSLLLATIKPKDGEDPMLPMKTATAFLLSSLERDGYTITRRESVPQVFRDFTTQQNEEPG